MSLYEYVSVHVCLSSTTQDDRQPTSASTAHLSPTPPSPISHSRVSSILHSPLVLYPIPHSIFSHYPTNLILVLPLLAPHPTKLRIAPHSSQLRSSQAPRVHSFNPYLRHNAAPPPALLRLPTSSLRPHNPTLPPLPRHPHKPLPRLQLAIYRLNLPRAPLRWWCRSGPRGGADDEGGAEGGETVG